MSSALEVSSLLWILYMSWKLCSKLRRNTESLEIEMSWTTAESIRRRELFFLSSLSFCVCWCQKQKFYNESKNFKRMHLLSNFQPPLMVMWIRLPWQPASIAVLRLVRSVSPSIVACLLRTQTLKLKYKRSIVYNSYCINLAKGQTREGNVSWWMSVLQGQGSTSTVCAVVWRKINTPTLSVTEQFLISDILLYNSVVKRQSYVMTSAETEVEVSGGICLNHL